MNKTFIIAEAGVNHNGSLEIAKQLIDVACDVGADAVKFQTFKANNVVSRIAKKARYQIINTELPNETQLEMAKKLELDFDAFIQLKSYAAVRGIMFLSSPFDLESVDFLTKTLDLPIIKIPSGEITNVPYLRRIGVCNKEIILSTGMSTLNEVRFAVDLLISSGTEKGKITVLHCNTEYPTPISDVNLNAMKTISECLGVRVGYSDHTKGIIVPIAAVALGAPVIEKHLTLDNAMEGPDHRASLDPREFESMVSAIRATESALGDGIKKPSPSEVKNIPIARKSIVASTSIKPGDVFSVDNLSIKRPGSGISPLQWDEVIGNKSKKSFNHDDLIEL